MRNKIMISGLVLLGGVLVLATLYYVGRGKEKLEMQATGEGVPDTVSPEFQSLLDVYSKAYAHYRINGDTDSKSVYLKAKRNIEETLNELRGNIDKDKERIHDFLKTYDNNAQDLEDLHEQSKKLEELTPQLQDQYATTMKRQTDTFSEPSVWILILKIALILVFIGIIAYLSFQK